MHPKVTDNEKGGITISLGDYALRGFSYENDAERRQKITRAHEYVEGWCDGWCKGRESNMADEPFGRQPKPVQIVVTGKEAEDVVFWVRHIKLACEFKGDRVEQHGSTQLTVYPCAVND